LRSCTSASTCLSGSHFLNSFASANSLPSVIVLSDVPEHRRLRIFFNLPLLWLLFRHHLLPKKRGPLIAPPQPPPAFFALYNTPSSVLVAFILFLPFLSLYTAPQYFCPPCCCQLFSSSRQRSPLPSTSRHYATPFPPIDILGFSILSEIFASDPLFSRFF